jgi:hypothetical protein
MGNEEKTGLVLVNSDIPAYTQSSSSDWGKRLWIESIKAFASMRHAMIWKQFISITPRLYFISISGHGVSDVYTRQVFNKCRRHIG